MTKQEIKFLVRDIADFLRNAPVNDSASSTGYYILQSYDMDDGAKVTLCIDVQKDQDSDGRKYFSIHNLLDLDTSECIGQPDGYIGQPDYEYTHDCKQTSLVKVLDELQAAWTLAAVKAEYDKYRQTKPVE